MSHEKKSLLIIASTHLYPFYRYVNKIVLAHARNILKDYHGLERKVSDMVTAFKGKKQEPKICTTQKGE
jgi:hypothetical protein